MPRRIPTARLAAFVVITALWGLTPARTQAEGERLSPGAEQVLLERLDRLHETTRTFTAVFEETRHLRSLPAPLAFGGRVYFDRSGLFFMEYEHPFRYILRVQAGEVLIYIEGSETADVSTLGGAEGVDPLNLFAWDPSRFEGTIREEEGGYRLTPDAGAGNGTGLSVLVDRETLAMKHMRITGQGGDVTEFAFSDVRINQRLPERVTRYRLPPGVERRRLDLQ
jgi:outer membrane lipoprotein-sorting protein